jgi:trans-aconitate methyltransferase
MAETSRHDAWQAGESYDVYMGRWSRRVAPLFLARIGADPGLDWLDVGCGTGALSSAILALCDPLEVVGVDQSEAHVAWTAAHVDDGRARGGVADAAHLPSVTVDVTVSGLVLNFLPDAGAALGAMCERAPAGVVAAYVWDYADRMDLMRHFWNVAVTLDPAADFDETVRFPICHPDRLRALWEDGGLTEVAVGAIDVPTVFRDFDDYWAPFLGGQGVAPAYVMSLDEQRRQELRERLRASVPVVGDGTVRLMARALAVRGRTG